MFRIITVEREFGSGAAEIAREIASRLGWKLWDQALTEEIAKVANVDRSAVMYCDERLDSTFHRLAKTFWRGSYERSMPLKGSEPFDADRFVAIGQEVMTRAATAGNVSRLPVCPPGRKAAAIAADRTQRERSRRAGRYRGSRSYRICKALLR